MLDISLGDEGTVLCPLEPANAFPPAPTEHLLLTPCAPRSVDDICTPRAPTTLLALFLLMPPFTYVLPLCLTTFQRSCLLCMRSSSRRICSRNPQFFFRLWRAHQGFFFACGGPRCANFWSNFLRQLFTLRLVAATAAATATAKRAARAWRLRPARGIAPRVSGSSRSVRTTTPHRRHR
jgi:hypothetical protein